MKPLSFLLFSALAIGQGRMTPGTAPFVTVNAPVVELQHVRVIDGMGAAPLENQTIVIDHGKIATVGPAGSTPAPQGAQVMDLPGHTVIPGIVGMHEHLFYPSGGGVPMYNEQAPSMATARRSSSAFWTRSPKRPPSATWARAPGRAAERMRRRWRSCARSCNSNTPS